MIFYRLTDEQCNVTAHLNTYSAPNVPVMFNEEGIFEMPSKFLMDVAINKKDVLSSVGTYADHLQAFFRYIETLKTSKEFGREKYSWKDVNDRHFHSFILNKQKEGRKDKYIGLVIGTVFRFYRWAEENKYLHKHVAIYDDGTYAISAKQNPKTGSWSWPETPTEEFEFRPVPTDEQLEEAHVMASYESSIVGQRDTLLMLLYERTARRGDALQLTIDQVPSEEEIEEAYEKDSIILLEVTGKRKVTRNLKLTPELAEELRDYIDGDRAAIVSKIKNRNKAYKDPSNIFISYNDGTPLSKTYISSRISSFFPEKITGQRIRAKGVTDTITAFDGNDQDGKPLARKDVLLRASEEAGWKNPESMRSYLANARSEHLASKIQQHSREKALAAKVERHRKKLSQYDELEPLVEAIDSGKDISLELLQMILDKATKDEFG